MTRTASLRTAFVSAALLPLGLAAAPAPRPADPPAATAPAGLADELTKAKARIAELEAEVARLKAQLATPPAAAPAAPASSPVADTAPFASPASVRLALEGDYTRSLAERLPAAGDQTAAAIFRRELERWVAGANRSYRHAVRWHGRLVRTQPQGERLAVTLAPVDPVSGDSLGEEFTATLEPRIARRLSDRARTAAGDPWTLVGTFIPEIRANPDRMERGIFDNPPLLGPGAEFRWRVEVESLVPARREPPAEPATEPAAPATP